ncbi:MAG: RsmE family RNA methyltransferase [Oligoflexales bacterium]|nr:RsmE family RNA methyltransferase [Oligoflexales bacterium]
MAHTFRFLAQPLFEKTTGNSEIDPETGLGTRRGTDPSRTWTIKEEELWHLRKVLRLKVGVEVEVFDGHGTSGKGVLQQVDSELAHVLTNEEEQSLAPSLSLALALGALKPGFIDDLLPILVELGINQIFVFAQEGSASWKMAKDKVVERWDRILLSSAKQCRQVFLPEIVSFSSPQELISYIESGKANRSAHPPMANALAPFDNGLKQKFVLSLGAEKLLSSFLNPAEPAAIPRSMIAAIGGESGLSPTEEETFQAADFLPVSLGPLTLRAFTAAIATSVLLSNIRLSKFSKIGQNYHERCQPTESAAHRTL